MAKYTFGEELGAFLIIVASALAGGIFTGLFFGINLPGWGKFPSFRLPPLIRVFSIPPLILMIIMGLVSRNYFGEHADAFPSVWAVWIKNVALCILLIRGGLQVRFKGKGLLVLFLSFAPSWAEAIVIAFTIRGLFGYPYSICWATAFLIACISPSIMVPGIINLQQQGYGTKKGIPSTLISSGTFDDIIAIILFGISQQIAYQEFNMDLS